MTITPELLRSRLDGELAPLPVEPRLRPSELRDRVELRRRRRRVTRTDTGVTLLAAAAAVVGLVVVAAHPTHVARVRRAAPTVSPRLSPAPTSAATGTPRPASPVARTGDVDGDGIVDGVSLVGGTVTSYDTSHRDDPMLVVQSSRYGRLSLVIPEKDIALGAGEGLPTYADVDLFATGSALVVLDHAYADSHGAQLVAVGPHGLTLLTTADGAPFELLNGGGIYTEAVWSCVSTAGTLGKPGRVQQYQAVSGMGGQWTIVRTTYALSGTQVVLSGSPTTTPGGAYAQGAAPGSTAYDGCGTHAS